MKPLPFDMTPLARSLSMATPSHAPTERESEADSRSMESATLQAMEISEPPEETLASDESGVVGLRSDIELGSDVENTPSEPTGKRAKRARKSKRKARAQQDTAQQDSKSTQDSTSSVPAERPQSVPTTELRRALYPAHICSGKSWAGRLANEQIHALATHVLARHAQQNLRTLAITSALAGEGKTTATLALAQKLAGADKRVLIMDLDTHRATLSHEAGLDDAQGALQSCDPKDIANLEFHAYETDVPGVTIMPVGHQPADLVGPPLVSPVHTGVLVLNALERYDIVLLDCPPLLPVAETFVLREVVDSAIMVIRAGSTPRDMLDQAIDDFGRDKFMGAILNRTKPGDIPYFREVYGYYRRDSTRG